MENSGAELKAEVSGEVLAEHPIRTSTVDSQVNRWVENGDG